MPIEIAKQGHTELLVVQRFAVLEGQVEKRPAPWMQGQIMAVLKRVRGDGAGAADRMRARESLAKASALPRNMLRGN